MKTSKSIQRPALDKSNLNTASPDPERHITIRHLLRNLRCHRTYPITKSRKILNKYYAVINRARGPYEEIFVLIFKAYGPKSRLIRALLYTYTNKIVYDEILLSLERCLLC